ncbi:MAG: phosphotransferase, partial [Burkholderiales bacterium]|nr:phosphotransferase [Burkholderiales bacterium]
MSQDPAASPVPLSADPAAIAWADPAREQAFAAWLSALPPEHGLKARTLRAASADASFRRYFRIDTEVGGQSGTLIVMDAPPSHEDCRPFVAVDRLLAEGGVGVPRILAWDEAQGFMLLSDLGAHTFLATLEATDYDHGPASANRARYLSAIGELLRIQAVPADGLPPYDDALLQRELDLFPEWYLTQLRGQPLDEPTRQTLSQAFTLIKAQVLAQGTVLVHRDFHSRNLMADAADPKARLGVIDFQDAVRGPVTYDLVSLLRDAYVIWDEDIQLDYAVRFWEQARQAGLPVPPDFGDFWRDFEWMGLQRHLKVLGIFARLALRDGKRQYLDDIPRVWTYAHRVASRYQGLGPLARLLEQA